MINFVKLASFLCVVIGMFAGCLGTEIQKPMSYEVKPIADLDHVGVTGHFENGPECGSATVRKYFNGDVDGYGKYNYDDGRVKFAAEMERDRQGKIAAEAGLGLRNGNDALSIGADLDHVGVTGHFENGPECGSATVRKYFNGDVDGYGKYNYDDGRVKFAAEMERDRQGKIAAEAGLGLAVDKLGDVRSHVQYTKTIPGGPEMDVFVKTRPGKDPYYGAELKWLLK